MAKSLGKLKRFNLQEYWGEEFDRFSSWLIQEETLEMIGGAIDLDLVPAKLNNPEGVLKGGVVAKNRKNDDIVLIQGELDEITHCDLGELLSSAAWVNSVITVWVASKIPVEQKRGLDWLNDVSRDGISFYGAELELWRIDDSAPAPNFSLVCQPKHCSRNVKLNQGHKEDLEPVDIGCEATKEITESAPQRKGDWTQKLSEEIASSQSEAYPEGVSVRENFVYTKSL